MKKSVYTITINAPKEKVWNTMLDLKTYEQWIAGSWPDSTYEGEWKEGTQIKFVGEDKSGTLVRINKLEKYKSVYAEHIAILLKGGVSDTESDFAREKWIGGIENYFFNEENGTTTLTIEIAVHPDFEKMMNDGWPNALKKLKEMCEK